MQARDLYAQGKLGEAIAAMNDEVRRNPTDTDRRGFLIELLLVGGELERADKQLESIERMDAAAQMGVALGRQLTRAEQWRQQFWTEGRAPEFLKRPDESTRALLEAAVRARTEGPAEAAQVLAAREELRRPVSGTCDGEAFEDFRDLDDLTADVFEVLTSNGKYYWIPTSEIESIEFHEPQRPRDLLWRRARMIVRDGPDGEVFLPAIYAPTPSGEQEGDDALRLGRATDWYGVEPVRGRGQRTVLVDEEDRTILSLRELAFEASN